MSFEASALIVAWAAIGLLAFALAGVLARVHQLELQLGGAEPVPTPLGRPLPLPEISDGPVLVLFVDTGCSSCAKAANEVAALEERGRARILWRDESPDAFAALEVTVTPFAIVADDALRIVHATPVGSPERLAEAVTALAELETGAPP